MKDLRKFIDSDITKEEALELFELKGKDMMELFVVANEIREKYCGNKLYTCTITNAKSGVCEEDCKFCAQSAHYNTGIKTYDLKEKEEILEEYKKTETLGSSKFGVVTSGRDVKQGTKDFEDIKEFIKIANQSEEKAEVCASIGILDYEAAKELKATGLSRYHSNLQSSKEAYSRIVATTHSIDNRIESIKNAKRAGLEVCSGGIIGMGETHAERIDMAFTLKELDVDGIPINILNPIKGTPHGERDILEMDEILKTISIYRLILKNKVLKIGAGREGILKDFMGMAFMSGANGMLVGGYLTVKGRSHEEDELFIKNINKMWGN